MLALAAIIGIAIHVQAPAWVYWCVGITAVAKCIKLGFEIAN